MTTDILLETLKSILGAEPTQLLAQRVLRATRGDAEAAAKTAIVEGRDLFEREDAAALKASLDDVRARLDQPQASEYFATMVTRRENQAQRACETARELARRVADAPDLEPALASLRRQISYHETMTGEDGPSANDRAQIEELQRQLVLTTVAHALKPEILRSLAQLTTGLRDELDLATRGALNAVRLRNAISSRQAAAGAEAARSLEKPGSVADDLLRSVVKWKAAAHFERPLAEVAKLDPQVAVDEAERDIAEFLPSPTPIAETFTSAELRAFMAGFDPFAGVARERRHRLELADPWALVAAPHDVDLPQKVGDATVSREPSGAPSELAIFGFAFVPIAGLDFFTREAIPSEAEFALHSGEHERAAELRAILETEANRLASDAADISIFDADDTTAEAENGGLKWFCATAFDDSDGNCTRSGEAPVSASPNGSNRRRW